MESIVNVFLGNFDSIMMTTKYEIKTRKKDIFTYEHLKKMTIRFSRVIIVQTIFHEEHLVFKDTYNLIKYFVVKERKKIVKTVYV